MASQLQGSLDQETINHMLADSAESNLIPLLNWTSKLYLPSMMHMDGCNSQNSQGQMGASFASLGYILAEVLLGLKQKFLVDQGKAMP